MRARVSAPLLAEIADAAGPEWMPFAASLELTRALHGGLGERAFEAFFREQQLRAFRGPLLRAIVDGAVALFGLDPGSWIRLVPRG